MVDQVLRGGALDFGEADKGGRGRVRLVGDLDEMPEVEALAVCAVFEGHGDGGAGREGLTEILQRYKLPCPDATTTKYMWKRL